MRTKLLAEGIEQGKVNASSDEQLLRFLQVRCLEVTSAAADFADTLV